MIEELREAFMHAATTLKRCAPDKIPFTRGFIDWLLDEYNETSKPFRNFKADQ